MTRVGAAVVALALVLAVSQAAAASSADYGALAERLSDISSAANVVLSEERGMVAGVENGTSSSSACAVSLQASMDKLVTINSTCQQLISQLDELAAEANSASLMPQQRCSLLDGIDALSASLAEAQGEITEAVIAANHSIQGNSQRSMSMCVMCQWTIVAACISLTMALAVIYRKVLE